MASERVFSSAGDLVSAQRSCLPSEHEVNFFKEHSESTLDLERRTLASCMFFLLHPCNRLIRFLLILYPQIEGLGVLDSIKGVFVEAHVVYVIVHYVIRIKRHLHCMGVYTHA